MWPMFKKTSGKMMVGTSFSCHIDCVKRQLQFRLLPTQPQLHLRFPAGGWGHWDKRLPVVALVDALDAPLTLIVLLPHVSGQECPDPHNYAAFSCSKGCFE